MIRLAVMQFEDWNNVNLLIQVLTAYVNRGPWVYVVSLFGEYVIDWLLSA